jgi:hypothetical protein
MPTSRLRLLELNNVFRFWQLHFLGHLTHMLVAHGAPFIAMTLSG